METKSVMRLYQKLVNEELTKAFVDGAAVIERDSVYSLVLTVWLMISQRLNPDHSLSAAVESVQKDGAFDQLDRKTVRARGSKISRATGGYSRARGRVPFEAVCVASDAINESLMRTHRNQEWKGRKVFAIDGATLKMAYTSANVSKYPQMRTRGNVSHFPLLRFGIATDVITGVSLRPSFGAYRGEDSTDELSLGEEALKKLPKGSVVLGDRLYGCARFAAAAHANGLETVCRVREKFIRKYIGEAVSGSGEVKGEWASTLIKGKVQHRVSGRFIWHTMRDENSVRRIMYFFTTTDLSIAEIAALYPLRWNVELDLRAIKSTLGMDMLSAKNPDMVAKEIVLGFVAYNLVRHILIAPAQRMGVSPRDLSFSRMLKTLVATGDYAESYSKRNVDPLSALQEDQRYLKLPKRKKPRPSEPRKVWPKGEKDSLYMRGSREQERDKLIKNRTVES